MHSLSVLYFAAVDNIDRASLVVLVKEVPLELVSAILFYPTQRESCILERCVPE